MKVLVVGGAGYIGAHLVRVLLRNGHSPVVLDDLSRGAREAVGAVPLVHAAMGDAQTVAQVLQEQDIDAVVHLAGRIEAGASVMGPSEYYQVNVVETLGLLDAMVRVGVLRLVFASSAAVYDPAGGRRAREDDVPAPASPYGRTKLIVERVLADYRRAYGLHSVSLRCFNAAGADPSGGLGERHEPETHLIPRLLASCAGRAGNVPLFGDGGCVRDYVHVLDLCNAHLAALLALDAADLPPVINLGTGAGASVLEVVAAARHVTGCAIELEHHPPRSGDSTFLIADASLARAHLGWEPEFPDVGTMIEHAWRWELAGRRLSP